MLYRVVCTNVPTKLIYEVSCCITFFCDRERMLEYLGRCEWGFVRITCV